MLNRIACRRRLDTSLCGDRPRRCRFSTRQFFWVLFDVQRPRVCLYDAQCPACFIRTSCRQETSFINLSLRISGVCCGLLDAWIYRVLVLWQWCRTILQPSVDKLHRRIPQRRLVESRIVFCGTISCREYNFCVPFKRHCLGK